MPQSTTSSDGFIADDGFVPEDTRNFANQEGPGTRFLKNLWEQVNPLAIVGGMGEAALHPVDTIKGVLSENQRFAEEATAAAKAGDYKTAVRKGLAFAAQVLPGVGSTLDAAASQAEQGDIAGAAGKSIGLGAQIALAPRAAGVAAKTPATVSRLVRAVPGRAAEILGQPGGQIAKGLAKYGAGAMVPLPVVRPLLREAGRRDIAAGIKAMISEKEPAAPVVPPIYDDIAQALDGKKYASLDESGQAAVRRIADAKTVNRTPPPATPRPPAGPSVPFEAPPSKYAAQIALRDKLTATPPEVAEPAPPPAAAPATEPLPATPAPRPPETPAPQVSGTTAGESPGPAVPGQKAKAVEPSAPQFITEDALSRYAADVGLELEEARAALESEGYKAVGRSHLNRALHGLGNEMGLDHAALSDKAAHDYGVKSLTQLSQDELLGMYDDLQSKRSISEPLKPKPERALTGPEVKKLAEFLKPGGMMPADLPRMTPEHWKIAADAAGVRIPTGAIVGKVAEALRKLQAPAKRAKPGVRKVLGSGGTMQE